MNINNVKPKSGSEKSVDISSQSLKSNNSSEKRENGQKEEKTPVGSSGNPLSVKEFLDFLSTAYRLNEISEETKNSESLDKSSEIDAKKLFAKLLGLGNIYEINVDDACVEGNKKIVEEAGLKSVTDEVEIGNGIPLETSSCDDAKTKENVSPPDAIKTKENASCSIVKTKEETSTDIKIKEKVCELSSIEKSDRSMEADDFKINKCYMKKTEVSSRSKSLSHFCKSLAEGKVIDNSRKETDGKIQTKEEMYLLPKYSGGCKSEMNFIDKNLKENSTKFQSFEYSVRRKLNDIIQEGLLDSVLPYIVPNSSHPPIKKPLMSTSHHKQQKNHPIEKLSSEDKKKEKSGRRKSSSDIQIDIHVCDEAKNIKQDFQCSQKLLISKMGYFAEVTSGQKLEDVDISVHCDIAIFDWLLKWVKKDITPPETWPNLEASNVISIMVSSAFLQMDPLTNDCITFFKENVNDVIRYSSNLSCLNDNIMTRISNLFSNEEVERLRDKKDKIQSRLFCKLITQLADSVPDAEKGHYSSLSGLYRCLKCGKLIHRQFSRKIQCKSEQIKIDRYGFLHSKHSRDPRWNLNDHVRRLYSDLKSWRRVYWRLWAECHFLQCKICHQYYSLNHSTWCQYHPDVAQFFNMENQKTLTFPIGRYNCCGARVYRFEILSNVSGCQFKDHVPDLNTERDHTVQSIFTRHSDIISMKTPALNFPERFTRLVTKKESEFVSEDVKARDMWWVGLELLPQRTHKGLLEKSWNPFIKSHEHLPITKESDISSIVKISTSNTRKQASQYHANQEEEEECSDYSDFSNDSESDSDECENNSEESAPRSRKINACRRRTTRKNDSDNLPSNRHLYGKAWIKKLSVRNNQDNQRETEEKTIKQLSSLLTRKTSGDISGHHSKSLIQKYNSTIWTNHIIPPGGTFIRLEQEWRDCHHNKSNSLTNNLKQRTYSASFSVKSKYKSGK